MSHKSKILIVDDQELERDSLKFLLQRENYDLHFADDALSGLEAARRVLPDLILLDVIMPGMDGFEMCRQLRGDPLLAEMPVILITALDEPQARLQGLEAGADDFISKPFDSLELRARVRSVTRLNRYRRLLGERRKFESAVEHSLDAYLLLDAAQNIVYANNQAQNYLRLSELCADKNFLECANGQYECVPEAAWHNWPAAADDKHVAQRYLVRPETRQANSLWLTVQAFPLPDQGGGAQMLVRLHDSSSEVTLRQQAWSFHRLIAHKLRTPMTGLQLVEILRQRLVSAGETELLELIDMIKSSAERQETQLSEVLRYIDSTRLGARDESDAFHLAGLAHFVEELREDLGIDVTLKMADDLADRYVPLSIHGMEVILRELLHNARKFHPRQQPRVELDLTGPDGGTLQLRCRDNGRCLSPEDLNKVWLPYYQCEKSFTGEVKGMGLGLSGVSSIVWSVGGHCALHNRKDGVDGVIVQLDLPCHLSSPTDRPCPTTRP